MKEIKYKCPVCKNEEIINVWTEDVDGNKSLCSYFYMTPEIGYTEDETSVVICANCGIVYKPKEN